MFHPQKQITITMMSEQYKQLYSFEKHMSVKLSDQLDIPFYIEMNKQQNLNQMFLYGVMYSVYDGVNKANPSWRR